MDIVITCKNAGQVQKMRYMYALEWQLFAFMIIKGLSYLNVGRVPVFFMRADQRGPKRETCCTLEEIEKVVMLLYVSVSLE